MGLAFTGLYLSAAKESRSSSSYYYHSQAIEMEAPLIAMNETLQDGLWDFSNQLVDKYLDSIL